MLSLVLVTESEQTQQFITILIIALLVFGGVLFLMTLWYWRATNPKRRVRRVLQPAGGGDVDLRQPYPGGDPRLAAQGRPAQGYPAQGYPAQGYPAQGYPDQRGYDPRYASPGQGGGGQRYVPPGGGDDPARRRLLQEDERDPYGYGGPAQQPTRRR